MRKNIEPIIHFFAIFAIYLLLTGNYLVNDKILFEHDNMKYNLPFFTYFAESIKQGFGLPLWEPSDGGTPIGITSVSFFPYLPHRIAGYIVYLASSFSIITSYKLTLVTGIMLISTGLWFFLRRLTGSLISASVGTVLFMIGGCGITVFHQEQLIPTAISAPWAAFFALKIHDDRRYIVPLAGVVGYSLTTHYPHIHLLFYILCIAVLLVTRAVNLQTIKKLAPNRTIALTAVVIFLTAIAPAIYLKHSISDFRSPVRQSASSGAETFDEYVKMNRIQMSSINERYFMNYLSPSKNHWDDFFVCFATYPALLLAVLAIIFDRRKAFPAIFILALLSWCALGVNGYLAQGLYLIRFPLIGQFRQWYHFLHLINLVIATLAGIGFAAIIGKLTDRGFKSGIVAPLMAVVILIPAFVESKGYFTSYVDTKLFVYKRALKPSDLSKESFLEYLNQGYFNRTLLNNHYYCDSPNTPAGISKLLVYKSSYNLRKACENRVVLWPFVTTSIIDDTPLKPDERAEAVKDFCSLRLDGKSAIVTLGGSMPAVATLPASSMNAVSSNPNSFYSNIPPDGFRVTPAGADLDAVLDRSSLIVFPFAYDLGLKAVVNGQRIETLSSFNGAMTAIAVPPGRSLVQLNAPITLYEISVIIQAVAMIISFFLVIMPNGRKDR